MASQADGSGGAGHGHDGNEQLREEIRALRREVARLKAAFIVAGLELPEPEPESQRPKLRLIKGGLFGGAVIAGVDWLRGHKPVGGLALVAAVTAIVVALIIWRPATDDDSSDPGPFLPPPVTSPTPGPTSLPPTIAPTPTPSPTPTPPASTPIPTLVPTPKVLPTATIIPSGTPTTMVAPPTRPPGTTPPAARPPTTEPPSTQPPTTQPPTTQLPTMTPRPFVMRTCLRLRADELLRARVCVGR